MMSQRLRTLAVLVCAWLAFPNLAAAQTPAVVPPVNSRLGALEFKDGMPSQATLDKVYDHLDFAHAFQAFITRCRA